MRTIKNRLGELIVAATDEGLCMLEFAFRKSIAQQKASLEKQLGKTLTSGHHPILDATEIQLNEYLNGDRKVFDLPLHLVGSPFQINVWKALLEIPYGYTRSYLQQAQHLGDEKAIRAVATANGKNRISIVVPCHRIIGSDGNLTGYAGGLPKKKWLLQHEMKHEIKPELEGDQLGLF